MKIKYKNSCFGGKSICLLYNQEYSVQDVDKYYLGLDVGCTISCYLLNEVGSWQMGEVVCNPSVNTVDDLNIYIISMHRESD